MVPFFIVVGRDFAGEGPKMGLAKDHHLIQTLGFDSQNKAFRERIEVGRLCKCIKAL